MDRGVLVFIEVIQEGKAPNLKYVSVRSDVTTPDSEFISLAINYLSCSSEFDSKTKFEYKTIHYFKSYEEYETILKKQVQEYLEGINQKSN